LSQKWGGRACPPTPTNLQDCQLSEALAELWGVVDAANQFVDSVQPWALAKAMKAGDEAAGAQLRAALGDLVEACR